MIRFLLRLTLTMFLLISLIGGVTLLFFNTNLIDTLEYEQVEGLTAEINTTNIIIVILIIISFGTAITTLIIIETKGLKTYKNISKNLDITDKTLINLKNINLPDEDEFGNLGKRIKNLINTVIKFDEMKKSVIQKTNSQLDFLMDNYPEPLIILDYMFKIKKINNMVTTRFQLNEDITNNKIFEIMEFTGYNFKAMADSYEKQTIDCIVKLSDNEYKAMVNFKRFAGENETQEYILLFSEIEKHNSDTK